MASSTTGSSPSASASASVSSSTASSAAFIDDSKATENRLYQASLILEWQLYNELLGRHRQAVARLQDLTNEAAALREENSLLRSSNEDLKRRIVSRLLAATRSTNHSVSPPSSSPIGYLPGDQRSFSDQLTDTSMSTTQSCESGDWRRNSERTSLPRSISVRSTGFMKIDHANHQRNMNNLVSNLNPSIMENKIVTMNQTRLNIQKQEAEVALTSIEVDAYYQGTYKTELCNKWQETGTCPYKDQCQFAHGVSQLRPVLRHPRYKTEVCRMVLAGVPCPYGHRCHFRHALPRPQDS